MHFGFQIIAGKGDPLLAKTTGKDFSAHDATDEEYYEDVEEEAYKLRVIRASKGILFDQG